MDQACLKMWEHGYYLLVKCGKSQFLMGKSQFSMGKSPFSMGKSQFLMGKLNKLTKNYGKSPCYVAGKIHYFDWAIFNSYVRIDVLRTSKLDQDATQHRAAGSGCTQRGRTNDMC